MFKPPAHKSSTAAQIVNPIPEQYLHQYIARKSFDRHPYLKTPTCEQHPSKKKLSFEEWMSLRFPAGFGEGNLGFSDLSSCWRVAQENHVCTEGKT